ncbi:MAG TPA: hypothetical protein VIN10_02420 [Bacteroidales bacterium]
MNSKRTYLLFISIAFLLLRSNSVCAQDEKWLEVRFNTVLESILQLNIDPDAHVEFGIKEINDNLFQITEYPEPVMFSIEATNNWNLTISASAEYFSGAGDSSLRIPVDFIGYTIESYGTNWDNGDFSNIINLTKDTLYPLETERRLVLKNGRRNNIGGNKQNFFIIRWNFFDENEQMNIKKMSNFNMTDDTFKVGLVLTLAENLTIDAIE